MNFFLQIRFFFLLAAEPVDESDDSLRDGTALTLAALKTRNRPVLCLRNRHGFAVIFCELCPTSVSFSSSSRHSVHDGISQVSMTVTNDFLFHFLPLASANW